MIKNFIACFFLVSIFYCFGNSVVYADGVSSCISCFNCPEQFEEGTKGEACGAGLDICMKSVLRYPGGVFISKSCSSSDICKDSSLGLFGLGYSMACCNNTNDCNSAMKTNLSSGLTIASFVSSSLIYIYYFKN